MFLAGWGTVDEAQQKLSDILQQVQVPVITNEKCKQSYAKFKGYKKDFQFDDRVVCAGFEEGGKDSCQGDSGGPLMLPIYENGTFPFYQIGVISFAEGKFREYRLSQFGNTLLLFVLKAVQNLVHKESMQMFSTMQNGLKRN